MKSRCSQKFSLANPGRKLSAHTSATMPGPRRLQLLPQPRHLPEPLLERRQPGVDLLVDTLEPPDQVRTPLGPVQPAADPVQVLPFVLEQPPQRLPHGAGDAGPG